MTDFTNEEQRLVQYSRLLFPETDAIYTVVRGQANNGPCWALAEIPRDCYLKFQQAQLSPTGYDLGDYGTILAQGDGEHPPQAMIDEILKKEREKHPDFATTEELKKLVEDITFAPPARSFVDRLKPRSLLPMRSRPLNRAS